ncbi:amino acid permease [Paenibacillus sp. YAF4_2]|uniref:amino acid permease n=1 Tax=Paenibacillus sp. YAF4_2 TaxID=3233085 RepID=UPI003F9955F5
MEHLFAVIKLAAIVIFVIIAVLSLMGIFGIGKHEPKCPLPLFPQGIKESWASMIYAFYSFVGIEVMGLLAIRLKDPKEAPKSGRVMISTLTALYIVSITLALSLAPWTSIGKKESPFVSSLEGYGIVFVPHLFNVAFIIAGFSTMIASLFAVTKILVTLAKDGNAPSLFSKASKGKRSMPYFALLCFIQLVGPVFT